MRLQNQVAIVTGATSGFGEAIARALAREGVSLAIGARREARLKGLEEELKQDSPRILALPLDVRETDQVANFVREVVRKFGRIDILINNAGLALGKESILTAPEEDWVQMMDTNFLGVFRMTQAVLKEMKPKRKGHIVNIGSIAGHQAYEGGAGYCGSKFALTAFTKVLRSEVAESEIKVTSIDPGMAETEFSLVRFKGDAKTAKQVYDGVRPLVAADIAETVLFALTRPAHVNIDEIHLTTIDQPNANKVIRR